MEDRKTVADLATELLRRGASVDQVFEVINASSAAQGHRGATPRSYLGLPTAPRAKVSEQRTRGEYVTHDRVLAAIGEAGRPITRNEVVERTGADRIAVNRHLLQGVRMGNVMKVGRDHFDLTKAGRVMAKDATPHAGKKATGNVVPIEERLSFDRVLRAIRKLGRGTVRTIRETVGTGSDQAIRMHVRKGIARDLIVEHETEPLSYSVKEEGSKEEHNARRRKTQKRVGAGVSAPGANDARIAAAMKASGKPMDVEALQAADPAFRAMRKETVGMALYTAMKRGITVRVEKGLYALAGKAPAAKARAPAKKLAPESVESASQPAPVQLAMVN